MHKTLKKLGSIKPNFSLIIVGLIVVALIMLWAPLARFFNTILGGVNGAAKGITDFLGLSKGADDNVKAKIAPGVGDPWNIQFWQKYADRPGVLPTDAKVRGWIDGIHKGMSPWQSPPIKMPVLVGVFSDIPTKTQFSFFCHRWLIDEGTSLAQWMETGWVLGAISVSDTQFKTLTDIVDSKPEY